ncbi:aminotransferase [Ilyonectria robusta]|uniref:aminotransferase n=1 Tax=Ilyonectria robusta TaxID=1079257 RepID=UPI001E8E1BF1|nr:aminotransferase [Ilyonectria robusta]KAH8669925.1 aminotransferase [Ilyonectria robusta]
MPQAPSELNTSPKPLDASNLKFTRSTVLTPVPEPGSAEQWAQNVCCDHMVTCRWTAQGGWEAPELKPFGDMTISPAASCLHYATQCFEGMKVYRGFDGKLRLFRPDRNAKRLVMSSKRVSLPGFDDKELVKLIMALMRVDGPRWLPKDEPGKFLYIRPAMIGNGRQIGVQIPQEATLFIIAIAWPDFSSESPPGALPRPPGLRLLTSENGEARAWPGGFGYAKVGANYGPSFVALGDCRQRGYDQILWVLGDDCQVTEAGASNFFAVVKNTETGRPELLTAPLTDKIILEGVTRQSVLDLARSRLTKELAVVEKKFTMYELERAWDEGRVLEAFVSGTAFFISPVSVIHFGGRDLDIPLTKGADPTYATLMKGWLKDIMYGVEPHEWGVVVEEEAKFLPLSDAFTR